MRKLIKNRLRNVVRKLAKVETQKVYCINSGKEQEANHFLLFGIYVGTSYSVINEPPLGI